MSSSSPQTPAGALPHAPARRSPGRIWRGLDTDHVPAASFAVQLPVESAGTGTSVADRIEAARAEAYARGRADAAAELAASFEGERRAAVGRLADAVAAAAAKVAEQRRSAVLQAERELVSLAVDLAEALVQHELAVGRSAAVGALERALGLVPSGEDLVVRLHPGDVIDAVDLQGRIPDRQVLVVADPGVEPGGCVVDAGPCHVDAQIGPALARAREVVAQLRPPGRGPARLEQAGVPAP